MQSAVEAAARLEPVSLRAGAEEAYININRRERKPDGTVVIGNNPDGPVDSSVQLVQVFTQSGALLATLVNYAFHPVVMGTSVPTPALKRRIEEHERE